MDYGKYKYERDIRQKEARKKQSRIEVKEIKFRPKIDPHDYATKKGHVVRFLNAGARVKVTIMFRGREMAHTELGRKILDRLVGDLKELATVDSYPSSTVATWSWSSRRSKSRSITSSRSPSAPRRATGVRRSRGRARPRPSHRRPRRRPTRGGRRTGGDRGAGCGAGARGAGGAGAPSAARARDRGGTSPEPNAGARSESREAAALRRTALRLRAPTEPPEAAAATGS